MRTLKFPKHFEEFMLLICNLIALRSENVLWMMAI